MAFWIFLFVLLINITLFPICFCYTVPSPGEKKWWESLRDLPFPSVQLPDFFFYFSGERQSREKWRIWKQNHTCLWKQKPTNQPTIKKKSFWNQDINYFYIFVCKSHLVAFQWREFSILSEVHSLALENVFLIFFKSSSIKHICSFFISSDSFKPTFSSGSWSCVCVSPQNVLGSDPHEAKHRVPGQAEELSTWSRVAAFGLPTPGHPLAPKLCLGTTGGHSNWHWSKLCCNQVIPTA